MILHSVLQTCTLPKPLRRSKTVPMHYNSSDTACTAWVPPWLHSKTCGSLNCNVICIWTSLWSETVHLWYCLHLRAEVCARALMVRYFDLHLCDKSTFPVIIISRNMQWNCPLSITVYFLSIMIEEASSEGYERKESGEILRGQSHVYWFSSSFFSSLHVKHHRQWNTLQTYCVCAEWVCF